MDSDEGVDGDRDVGVDRDGEVDGWDEEEEGNGECGW